MALVRIQNRTSLKQTLEPSDINRLNNDTPNSVSHLVSLIDSGAYATVATFYRIVQDFVDQGGSAVPAVRQARSPWS